MMASCKAVVKSSVAELSVLVVVSMGSRLLWSDVRKFCCRVSRPGSRVRGCFIDSFLSFCSELVRV